MKDILRETHITCGKKNVFMVLGRFINVFGSGYDFVDENSHQVYLNLLCVLQVHYGGKLMF